MDFSIFIVLGILGLIIYLAARMDQKIANKYSIPELKEKRCPIHKWEYENQPGYEDLMYLRCQWCKKTPQEINEGR